MMFIVPPERRRLLITALDTAGGLADVVAFTDKGVTSWRAPAGHLTGANLLKQDRG